MYRFLPFKWYPCFIQLYSQSFLIYFLHKATSKSGVYFHTSANNIIRKL